MRNLIIVLAVFVFNIGSAQQNEVRGIIDTFFEGFHAQDTIKMKSVLSDQLVLQSIAEGPSGAKLTVESMSELLKSIASVPSNVKFEERLLSYNIQIDGSMANVWTPYEFYFNGKLSHRGVNSFQMYKSEQGWKIVYLIDTRRK